MLSLSLWVALFSRKKKLDKKVEAQNMLFPAELIFSLAM